MKRLLKVLGVIALFGISSYGTWWAYVYFEYRQHLPFTTIAVNGVERRYHLFVPTSDPDGPHSLLVLLHCGDAGSWRFPQQFAWEELAEEEGILIAAPVGKRVPPNEGAWQLNTDKDSMQDIDFVNAMIDEILKDHDVDPARVYAVGYSLGSMFSYELACQMSTRFTAIASHAGTMPVTPKFCEPERNVPIMHLHGSNDPIIAYGNTWDWKSWNSVGTMRDLPSLVQFWRDKYNCRNETRNETDLGMHFVYDMCDQDARVEHHRMEEVGHGWPESIDGVSTHQVLWSFLSKLTNALQ
jgi:polyhydroxybutyrate depolymerase